ncbi:MAG: metallophosphoesterase [Bacteroidales bacterium]|nr:metallophosphoesterase [Bacteroidales bacterium]
MKKILRTFCPFVIVIVMILFTACDKSDPDPVIGPFSNGSGERNMIVVISDLHLGADLSYAECNDNLAPLEKLLGQIRVGPNVKELVIGGDLIDEWFVPAYIDTYGGLGQNSFVKRVESANSGVFEAFNQIIKDGKIKVTYVPGNHDLAITNANVDLVLPGINQARDPQQGLGTYSPDDFSLLAIEHGHRYNFDCAPDPFSNSVIAPGSIMPSGYFFTRIAAQSVNDGTKTPGEALPAVIPDPSANESQRLAYLYTCGWDTLMKMFPISYMIHDKIIVTKINGFTENYSLNDVVPFQLTPGGYIDMNLYKGVQDNWEQREIQNLVSVKFPTEQAIADADDNGKTDEQANVQYFSNQASNKRIVVFGHTHAPVIKTYQNLNSQKCIYVNSGTWIDSNPFPTTKNFVVITEQSTNADSYTSVKLYNFDKDVSSKMDSDSLRFDM